MNIKELLEKRNAELTVCRMRIEVLKQQLTDQGALELRLSGAIEQLEEILEDQEKKPKSEE